MNMSCQVPGFTIFFSKLLVVGMSGPEWSSVEGPSECHSQGEPW